MYNSTIPFKKTTRKALLFCTLLLTTGVAVQAQSVSIGADIVNRYVWRGLDFGEAISIQPTLEFNSGAVTVGTWGSYAINDGGANEHDLYLSVAAGPVSFGLTDYYFPTGTSEFFNFDGEGEGSHWIEPFVSFGGTNTFPLSLYAGVMVHNDPDNSVYLQADYPFKIDGFDLNATLGVVPMESAFYLTDGFAVTALGVSAGRKIPISDSFALPVSVSYILNPEIERTYLIFGISL